MAIPFLAIVRPHQFNLLVLGFFQEKYEATGRKKNKNKNFSHAKPGVEIGSAAPILEHKDNTFFSYLFYIALFISYDLNSTYVIKDIVSSNHNLVQSCCLTFLPIFVFHLGTGFGGD